MNKVIFALAKALGVLIYAMCFALAGMATLETIDLMVNHPTGMLAPLAIFGPMLAYFFAGFISVTVSIISDEAHDYIKEHRK